VSTPPDPGQGGNYVAHSVSFRKKGSKLGSPTQSPIQDYTQKSDTVHYRNLNAIDAKRFQNFRVFKAPCKNDGLRLLRS